MIPRQIRKKKTRENNRNTNKYYIDFELFCLRKLIKCSIKDLAQWVRQMDLAQTTSKDKPMTMGGHLLREMDLVRITEEAKVIRFRPIKVKIKLVKIQFQARKER
jgi:hypothetical protein